MVQALLDRGDLAEGAPEILQLGHILTQAVGLDPGVEPDVRKLPLTPGDVFLLCSDGLSDLVPDAAIGAIIGAAEGDMLAAANALVATALNSGGHDNVTVLLARNDQSGVRAAAVERSALGESAAPRKTEGEQTG